eukprot:COSAG02_NODE_76_length_41115_cov_60.967817_1_plen_150_part_00
MRATCGSAASTASGEGDIPAAENRSRTGGSIIDYYIGPSAVGRGIKWWLIRRHFKTSTSDVLQLCGACYGGVDTGHKALMPGVNADSLVPGVIWLSLRGTFSFVWSGIRAFCPRGTLRRSVESSQADCLKNTLEILHGLKNTLPENTNF